MAGFTKVSTENVIQILNNLVFGQLPYIGLKKKRKIKVFTQKNSHVASLNKFSYCYSSSNT